MSLPGFQLAYLVPALAVLLAAFAPRTPLPATVRRAAAGVALATLAVAIGLRLGVIAAALRGAVPSAWDSGLQAIAGAWLNGQPIQPALRDGLFYRWAYGPLHYEILGVTQSWFGIGDPLVGLPMALAELAAAIVTWRLARAMGTSRLASTAATGLMVAELGLLDVGGVRSDQMLVLLAALALAAARAADRNRGAAVLLGLCGGLGMALKFTGFLYVLPALLPMLMQQGTARGSKLGLVAIGAVLGAVVPYLVPGAGITPQIFYEETSHYRPMLKAFGHNLLFTIIALLPPLLWSRSENRRDRAAELGWIALPWVPIFVIACNGAAGPWHLAPFLPAVTLCLARSLDDRGGIAARQLALIGALIALVLIDARQRIPRLFDRREAAHNAQLQGNIRRFLDAHPDESVAIGSGSGRRANGRSGDADVAYFQAEIPRAKRRLRFMEQSFVLVSSPATADIVTRKLFDHCAVTYWITGRGAPFAGRLYDPSLEPAFRARYRMTQADPDMAIWTCADAAMGLADVPRRVR